MPPLITVIHTLYAQADALVRAGAIKVFMAPAPGATQAGARWQDCLGHLQPGNILVVTDLTGLGGTPRTCPISSR